MSTEPWCDFGDLPADQCACSHCRPDLDAPPAREISVRFEAQYDGRGTCGHHIDAGDRIAFTRDNELLCTSCTAQATTSQEAPA